MALWQRIKRFGRSVMVLAISCLVLEQVWYSVMVSGYFLGVLVSPVFWGIFSISCFYLLWRIDPDFCTDLFKEETDKTVEYHLPYESNFMSPNYSRKHRELVMGEFA